MRPLEALVPLLAGLSVASAHGDGHDASREHAERRRFLEVHANNLAHCAQHHRASGLDDRAIQRRAEMANQLMERGLKRRQTSSIGKSHKSDQPFDATTDPKIIFGGQNSCVLSPETTEGPFYVLGQSVRSKLVDDQVGVPLHLDFQIIDVNTCEPVQGVFLEIWSVNATGVYSGALAPPNGSGMGDRANLDRNFLRGVQQTDSDGVAQFSTLFPGHYSGRATHVHVASHFNATAAPNGTMWHTTMTHVGQVFFDQELVDSVEKLAPYNTNRQPLMRNNVDNILLQEAATSDPFFHYRVLGDDLHRDGVLAWFRFGVNVTFTRDVLAVAMRFSDGGKMVTTNPRVFPFLFPGGFPTAYMPGFGGPAAPAPAPTGKAKGKGMARRAPVARPGTNSI